MAKEYDLIVVGAGTGGYVAAIRAAQIGIRTAKDWGISLGPSVPREPQGRPEEGRGAAGSGQAGIGIDMTQVQTRKDRIVTGLTRGVEFLFKKNKIDWIKGTARLTGSEGFSGCGRPAAPDRAAPRGSS